MYRHIFSMNILLILIINASNSALIFNNLIKISTSSSGSLFDELLRSFNSTKCSNSSTSCAYSFVPYNGKCDACSERTIQPNIRIVGGKPAEPHSWPSEVLILLSFNGTFNSSNILFNQAKRLMCGGTLINRYTIITAAHCIYFQLKEYINYVGYDLDPNLLINGSIDLIVYAGAVNTSSVFLYNDPPSPSMKLSVKSFKIHENYLSGGYTDKLYDIALIYLALPVDRNTFIQTACIPNVNYGSYPHTNQTIYAAGRGWINDTYQVLPDVLYNVNLTVYQDSFCSNVQPFYAKQWNKQFCAGEYNGGRDTCFGDSGGGVYVYDNNTQKYIVVGITSYGHPSICAQANMPAIYTRLSFYYYWITKNWETDTCISNIPNVTNVIDFGKNDSNSINERSKGGIIFDLFIFGFVMLFTVRRFS